ncbi:hypothetical protein Dimus_030365, partial [Dionaea muscipula]
ICGDFLVKVRILGVFDCRSPRGSCAVALVADGAGAQGDSASGDGRGNMYISADIREKCMDQIYTTDQDKLTKGFLIYTTDQDLSGFTNTNYTGLSELYSKYKDQVVVKRATVKKSSQVAKIPNPRAAAAAENIKQQQRGEQRVDLGLPTAIDLGAGKEAAAKAQNGGERKCEAEAANVIIISTETSNGRAMKERSRKKKTGGGPTFNSLLTARSKDLIIVNIDEASGDDELAVAEYVEDIYKFYKLIEGESQVCDYMGKQPDIDERMRSIL